ncbi:hypothetical protein PRZ48_008807 [Zasmidium cellare]|uniref:Uncharacterized protein n=1 Tax=Zasmidium cellare TaxID=395010 RepID=A0ABR0EHS1_ZASCE|nr:hypothetical protein PRZ48_008807 [Zasmidium cellare]
MASDRMQPVHGHPIPVEDTPAISLSTNAVSTAVGEPSFRIRNDGNLARSHAQSWAFEPLDDDVEDVTNKPIVNPLRLAAAAPDYGSYCERCGTPKAAGVPTEEATNAKKEWVIEARIKAKKDGSAVKKGDSKEDVTKEGQDKEVEGGDAGRQGDEGIKQVKEDGDVKLEVKKDVASAGGVCDRCGAEDGEDGKFWPFHVLDSGSVERIRRDS